MSVPEPRQAWISLLAKCPPEALAARYEDLNDKPAFTWLRAPEIGAVMVRGRTGGTGAAFNLGEMTITRCSLKLDSGEVGHAYVQGRNRDKAEQAAVIDALMQTVRQDDVRALVLDPIAAEMAGAKQGRAAKAAATRVDFFTMVRGED